jgi:hypothetical protein
MATGKDRMGEERSRVSNVSPLYAGLTNISQIVNLKNIIEVNNKEPPTFSHMSSGLSRIQEEGGGGDGRMDLAEIILGKRPRDGSVVHLSLVS